MGLSTHEMLIALRVRDEASRILNRFSTATSKNMAAGLRNIATQSQELQTKMRTVNSELALNKTNLGLVESALGSNIKQQENLRTKANNLIGTYTNLRSTMQQQSVEYSKNTNKIRDLSTNYQSLVSKQDAAKSSLQSYINVSGGNTKVHADKIAALKTEITEIDKQKASIASQISTISRQNDAIKTTITSTKDKSKAVWDELGAIGKQREALETSTEAMRKHQTELANGRQSLLDNKDALEQRKASLEQDKQKLIEDAEAEHALIAKTAALGTAFTSAGIMITSVGVSIANTLIDASNSYTDYASTVAKTFTQVDNAGKKHQTTLQEVGDIGNSVASTLAVKFDEVQPALYDVFSTIETDGPGAKVLLEGIGKAAIGGSTDMQTAGRSVIGIMNAWHYSVNDVNKINDVMFQLVRKGVGDYDQFSAAISKATPSAVKAGQSVEELGAMLAFMTKNGMTSAQAGTSAARSFDMLSNPKFQENIKQFGLSAFDASGKIRPMGDVVADLRDKIQGMSDKERLDFIAKIGEGAGGTIQAMRFINLGLEDTKVNLDKTGTKSQTMFQTLRDQMKNSGGAAQEAYNIMSQTPEAKWQGMINEFTIFKNTIGEGIQPIRDFITNALTPMFEWFNKLDPGMKKNIATFAAITAGVLILVGIIATLIGVFLLVSAAAGAMGITMGMVLLPAIGIVAAIAALIAIGYLLVTNWDLIKTTAANVWNAIVNTVIGVGKAIMNFFTGLPAFFTDLWNNIVNWAVDTWNDFLEFMSSLWNNIVNGVIGFGTTLMNAAGAAFTAVINFVMSIWSSIYDVLSGPFNLFLGFFQAIWETIKLFFAAVFLTIVGLVTGNTALIVAAWTGFGDKIKEIWSNFWTAVITFLTTVITNIENAILTFIANVGTFFVNLGTSIKTKTSEMWNAVVTLFTKGIADVVRFVSELPGKITAFFITMGIDVKNKAEEIRSTMVQKFTEMVTGAVRETQSLPGKIGAALSNIGSQVATIGRNIVMGIVSGVTSTASRLVDAAEDAVNSAINAAKKALGIASPSKVFRWIGKMTVAGFTNALDAGRKLVSASGEKLASAAVMNPEDYIIGIDYRNNDQPPAPNYHPSPPGSVGSAGSNGNVYLTVNTEEIDPVKHAADLGYEVAKRLGM